MAIKSDPRLYELFRNVLLAARPARSYEVVLWESKDAPQVLSHTEGDFAGLNVWAAYDEVLSAIWTVEDLRHGKGWAIHLNINENLQGIVVTSGSLTPGEFELPFNSIGVEGWVQSHGMLEPTRVVASEQDVVDELKSAIDKMFLDFTALHGQPA